MATIRKVAVLVGSLRKDSLSRKTAHAAMALAPATLACEIVEIGALPHYNADLDGSAPPAEWVRSASDFRRRAECCS